VPVIVLAYYFQTAADLMESGLYVSRKTDWKLPITLGSTVVILGLYALLIPLGGIHGAAWGTLLGFMVMAALTGIVTQRVFPVRYEWRRVAAVLAWAVLFWLLGSLMPVSYWALPGKLLVWAGWLGVIWLTVLSDEEKRWMRPGQRRPVDRRQAA
jgi:O-antigen/teichoic acid export membrane protein